jgi:hypothetical protein
MQRLFPMTGRSVDSRPMRWMALVVIGVPAIAYGAWIWFRTEREMKRYWGRPSTATLWASSFPDATPADIRSFLEIFVDAFAFGAKRAFCFGPEDRLSEIYDALYPCGSRGAGGEMTCFYLMLQRRYGRSISADEFSGMSLGEIFDFMHAETN